MQHIENILPESFVTAIGWTIFHSVWQIALVSLAVGLLLLLMKRSSPQFRYLISISGFLFILGFSGYTFVTNYQKQNVQIVSEVTPENHFTTTAEFSSSTVIPPQMISPKTDTPLKTILISLSNFMSRHFVFISWVWLLSVLFLSLRFIGGLIHLHRLTQYRVIPMDGCWQKKVLEYKKKLLLTKPVMLMQSGLCKIPMAIGWLKPVVLLPASIVSGLSAREIECILAHELAHIKRNDYIINIIQKIVEILFFYHPAIWWLSTAVRSERENCCDDIAIALTGDNVGFVRALASVEEYRVQPQNLAVAFNPSRNNLLKRIQRILNQNTMKSNFKEGFIASCIVCAGIITMAFTFGYHPNDKAEKTPLAMQNDVLILPDTTTLDEEHEELRKLENGYNSTVAIKKKKDQAKTPNEAEQIEVETEQRLVDDEQRKMEAEQRKVKAGERRHETEQHKEEHELEMIIEEAIEEATRALEDVDLEIIISDAMESARKGLEEAEIEIEIRSALDEVNRELEELDLEKTIREALEEARRELDDADIEIIIRDAREEINRNMKEIHRELRHDDPGLKQEHTGILDQGVDAWNQWRHENPTINPQLTGVFLEEADLSSYNLSHARLTGANLKEAKLDNADLSYTRLEGANLKEASLNGTVFRGANLTGADLKEVNLNGHDLHEVKLTGTNLKEANLQDADLSGADLRGTNIKEANLMGANLRNADVRGADLSEADIKNTDFRGARANGNTLFPPNFKPGEAGILFE